MTDSAQNEVKVDEDTVEENPKSALLPIVVTISLLLALAGAAGAGYIWFYTQQEQLVQSQLTTTLNKKIASLEAAQKENQNQNKASQTRLSEQQQLAATRLDKISEKLGRNSHDWAVSEIRYTLRQASTRLQLFKEKETALVALKIADQQLAELADPALHKVRATLNKEIIALSSVKEIDLEGVSLTLSAIKEQVGELSVAQLETVKQDTIKRAVPEKEVGTLPEWKKHTDAIWSEMKSLVSIRRTDKKILPLLSEQESRQIKQALGLKIEIARLALLQRNTTLFRTSIKEATSWLNAYFNPEQAAVVAILEKLNAMNALSLEPTFPDISGALSQLETLQNNVAPTKEKTAK